eukprot:6364159-Amphidinium_carterae.1
MDRRHMAEHTGPFALSDPESHGLENLYPSSRPRASIEGMKTPYLDGGYASDLWREQHSA